METISRNNANNGEKPLKRNHPLVHIGHETSYLTKLEEYLKDVREKRRTRDPFRNPPQFWDAYYELEIAHFLKKLGLNPQLNETICGQETDIFLEDENLVIEIKHLHIPQQIEDHTKRARTKLKAINTTFINMKRMLTYLQEKDCQDIYPNIVVFCPDIMAGTCDDLKNLIERHEDEVSEKVSALAIWKYQEITCCLENPRGKKLEWKSNKLKKFFKLAS